MDRRADFVALKEMHMLRGNRKHNDIGRKAKRQVPVQGFTELTKRIAADISLTTEKLEKLQLICEECDKGAIHHAAEINNLTYIVKQDISALNRALNKVRELVTKRIGGAGHHGNHYYQHTTNITTALQRQLASVSEPFKVLLEQQSVKLKAERAVERQRQEQLMQNGVGHADLAFSSGPATELRARRTGAPIDGHVHHQDSTVLLMMDAHLEQRAERDKQTTAMEQTIAELGGIFSQLAGLVHDQGQMLERIDADIASTASNVESAHTEITKFFQSISTNRSLMLKIFATLLGIFTLFVMIRA